MATLCSNFFLIYLPSHTRWRTPDFFSVLVCLLCFFHYAHSGANWIFEDDRASRKVHKTTKSLKQWRPTIARWLFIFKFSLYNSWRETWRKKSPCVRRRLLQKPNGWTSTITSSFLLRSTWIYFMCFVFVSRAYGLLDVLSNWNDQIFVSSSNITCIINAEILTIGKRTRCHGIQIDAMTLR